MRVALAYGLVLGQMAVNLGITLTVGTRLLTALQVR